MKRWGKISFFRQNGKLVLAQNQNAKQLQTLASQDKILESHRARSCLTRRGKGLSIGKYRGETTGCRCLS